MRRRLPDRSANSQHERCINGDLSPARRNRVSQTASAAVVDILGKSVSAESIVQNAKTS